MHQANDLEQRGLLDSYQTFVLKDMIIQEEGTEGGTESVALQEAWAKHDAGDVSALLGRCLCLCVCVCVRMYVYQLHKPLSHYLPSLLIFSSTYTHIHIHTHTHTALVNDGILEKTPNLDLPIDDLGFCDIEFDTLEDQHQEPAV